MNKEIPKRSGGTWDGSRIYKTKDCDDCRYHRTYNGYELCGVGIAFKYLTFRSNPMRCNLVERLRGLWESDRAVLYLDEIIDKT